MAIEISFSGSDARRIMAGELMEVWEEKTGRRQPVDLSFHLPAMIGKATEAVNRAYFQKKTGVTVYDSAGCEPVPQQLTNFNVVRHDRLGTLIQNKTFPWIVGHLDGLVFDNRDWGVFESKHTGEVSDWNPPERVVEHNYWQGVHYTLLTELSYVEFSVIYGTSRWDHFRVEANIDHQTLLLGTLNKLRKAIETDTPPVERKIDAPAPAIVRGRAYVEKDVRALPIANEFADLAATIVATKPAHDKCVAALDAIKKLALPEDAKSVAAFGLSIAIAKNGAKTIKLAA